MITLGGEKLREARNYLGLSQMEAAELLGVSLVTYQRWEQGKARPQPYHLRQIRREFKPVFQALGWIEAEPEEKPDATPQQENEAACASVMSPLLSPTMPSEDESIKEAQEFDTSLPMTFHLLSLAYMIHLTNNNRLDLVRQAIKEYDRMNNNNKNYQITRREAIGTLAALPIATLGLTIPGSTAQPTHYATALAHCSASLEACWQLYRSSDASNTRQAFKHVSTYVPLLKTIASNASQYRQEALTLATQYALLKTLLGWICVGPSETLPYARDAVALSTATDDISLQLSAYSKLAWAYSYLKKHAQAMQTAQEAEALLLRYYQLSAAQPLHPSVYGGLYSTLAYTQAKNGASPDHALGKTTEVDPTEPYALMTVTRSTLLLQAGWAYCYWGDQTKVMQTLEKRLDPQTFAARMPQSEMGRIEAINVMALSSLKTKNRDMEQTAHFWVAGMEGAKALQHEQRFNEALAIYELMEVVWPGEKQIINLRNHIEHW